ncbi:MAG: alpha/beta fold hydrolase [Candidatus Moraniibacteriota bacterium]
MEKLELRNRKNQKIVGILGMPEGPVRGTAVVVHGFGGIKEQDHILKMEAAFRDNGFITFNFDATNSFGESEGEYWDARLGLHAEDLEDVVKWMRQQEWFREPLALTGHSMGGYAVARYAERYPDEVSILAPIAPVVSGELSFEAHHEEDPVAFEEFRQRGFKESVSHTSGRLKRSSWAEMEERLHHDLLPDAKKLVMPTLLVVGSKDISIRPRDVQSLYDALPARKENELRVIEGAPHTYRSREDVDALYEIISNWLKGLMLKKH